MVQSFNGNCNSIQNLKDYSILLESCLSTVQPFKQQLFHCLNLNKKVLHTNFFLFSCRLILSICISPASHLQMFYNPWVEIIMDISVSSNQKLLKYELNYLHDLNNKNQLYRFNRFELCWNLIRSFCKSYCYASDFHADVFYSNFWVLKESNAKI